MEAIPLKFQQFQLQLPCSLSMLPITQFKIHLFCVFLRKNSPKTPLLVALFVNQNYSNYTATPHGFGFESMPSKH